MMENEIVKRFYESFWLYIGIFIISIIVIIVLFIFRNKLSLSKTVSPLITFGIFTTIILVLNIFVVIKFIPLCKDFEAVQNKNFETFTGVVIGYTSINEGNDPKDPILGKPIFKEIGSKREMTFSLGKTEEGQTYTIIYLMHSKVAAIVK